MCETYTAILNTTRTGSTDLMSFVNQPEGALIRMHEQKRSCMVNWSELMGNLVS